MLGQLFDSGNTTTLAHYLDLLDSAGLLGGIEKYAGDRLRKRQSSPKLQVHNTALIAAQQSLTLTEISDRPELWGRVVESAIGAHLLNHARQYDYRLFYWRQANDEVDFILQFRGKILALEVKSTTVRNTAGMQAFRKKFHPDKVLFISENGLIWKEFLSVNPVSLF